MDAEVKVGFVGHDEGAGEEEPDGEDGAEECIPGDLDGGGGVEEVGCALEDACADGLRGSLFLFLF